jgi:hypothetical protein
VLAMAKVKALAQKKTQRDIVSLGDIKDPALHVAIAKQFKRLFVRLFQLNASERASRIFSLYFAQDFKQAILQVFKDYLDRNQRGNKVDAKILQQVRAFVFLNTLKAKYIKQKGLRSFYTYLDRLRIAALRTRILKHQFRFLVTTFKQKPAKAIARDMRGFVARLFQQKSFAYYQRYDPFRCIRLQQRQVKVFIADLFHSNRDIVGRPKNVFRTNHLE